jgi:hypothetical protein
MDKKQYEQIASNIWNAGMPLSKQEIAKLAEIIDTASKDILISITPYPLKTYLLGYRIQELIKKANSHAEIKRLLDDFKLPPVSDSWAAKRVAETIAKIVNIPVTQLKDTLAMEFIQQYMFQEITWHMDNMKNKIKNEMLHTLMNNESPLELARRLHKTFDTYDYDMRRVAITETTRARNMGMANEIQQTDPAGADALIYFLVAKDACPHCKRLYNYPDGSPRIFKLSDIKNQTNKGRTQQNWRAALIIHPNCRCSFTKYNPELMEWKKKWQARYDGKKLDAPKDMQKSVDEADKIKKVMDINGIQVAIEWPKGSTRTYTDGDWETEMTAHYGRIPGTESANDGMEIDCYVGDNPDSTKVYKLLQVKKDGKPDEFKYMLGYGSLQEAKDSYLEHMPESFYGNIKQISMDTLEHIIATNLKKPEIEKAIGDMKPGHKYIRREGEPGSYKYIYADETGKEYEGQEPEIHIKQKTNLNVDEIQEKANLFYNDKLKPKVVGYRYGEAPESGRSYNTRESKQEDGVSMASVNNLKESRSFATMSAKENRKKFYYEGNVVGHGGDDEPLISNINPISYNLLLSLI